MNLSRFIALRIYRSSDAGKQVSRPAVLIATVGVAIGLAVMIIAVSVIIGFKSEVRDKIIGFGSHIQISNSDAARSFETRRKYNDGLRDSEVFYRGQPDEQFANLYRKWSETPDTKAIILHYTLVIVILLLVPAINLSSMTLSRMRKRMAEIGVRKAFGATGGELMRQIFFENLLLTLFAGVLGLALSYAATFLLNGFLFDNSTNAYLSGETTLTPGMLLSPWAFLAAFGFCLLMNILSAGIPAWRASRMNITDAINQR